MIQSQSSFRQHHSIPSANSDSRIALMTPILNSLAEEFSSIDMSSFVFLIIVHFLGDLPAFINQLHSLGMKKSNTFLIPVYYSQQQYVTRYLRQKGWRVYDKLDGESDFEEHVNSVLSCAVEEARQMGLQLIIIEDGGYAVPIVLNNYSSVHNMFAGAVEQTANGVWRDKRAINQNQKNQENFPSFPIVAVGESELKKVIESPFVADAILFNIDRLLIKEHTGLRGRQVAVLGFGDVGSSVAHVAGSKGWNVGVFDPDYRKWATAKVAGFNVPQIDSHGEANLKDFINRYSLVLGASGHRSLSGKRLAYIGRNTYLASCSSKRLEIDISALESMALYKYELTIGTRYIVTGSFGDQISITVLANGRPINFFDGSESIPAEHIEFVWALMLGELIRIISGECQNGINTTDEELEQKIARLYLTYSD